ncbi:MAG: PilZ domain-containing protein [Gammaproteobacteria bacterium]|nr:PilZ domain-containing protein [Gammaproteobacteria bacterium]
MNRREQYRYIRNDKLFVQILAANEKVDVKSVNVLCHTCDASIGGLRVELEIELGIKTLVDLWVEFEGLEGKFYLRGQVCWCCQSENASNLYQVGIELESAYATDYDTWIELLESFSN